MLVSSIITVINHQNKSFITETFGEESTISRRQAADLLFLLTCIVESVGRCKGTGK